MNNNIEKFKNHLIGEEKTKNTIDKYISDIKEFYGWIDITLGNELVCNNFVITKDILLGFKEYMLQSKLKVATINVKISSINKYLNWLKKDHLKLKYIKCQKELFESKKVELSKLEFCKLHKICENNRRLNLLIETMAKTGIRVSEIKHITIESLDTGRVEINNKGKIRVILLPWSLCSKLKDYIKLNNDISKISNKERRVFVTKKGTPLNRRQIWQMMKRIAIKANISPEKVFPHNLRHLFAREFYKKTHDIVKLSSILGHNSIETTRIYAKETEDRCRREIENLDFLI